MSRYAFLGIFLFYRFLISITVFASLTRGCAVPSGATHLNCNSVEPNCAGLAGVVVTCIVFTSRPFFGKIHLLLYTRLWPFLIHICWNNLLKSLYLDRIRSNLPTKNWDMSICN